MTRTYAGLAAILAGGLCINCGDSPAAPTPPTSQAPSNHAPVASVSLSPAAVPIAGASTLTFTATASDPDGDPVTLSWQFGDGQAGSGATVSHVFAEGGTYAVVLTATDSHGESAKVTTNVVVKGLDGDWVEIAGKVGFTFEQHGQTFDGVLATNYSAGAIRGSVADPRSLRFELAFVYYPGGQLDYYRCYYEGALDDTGDQFHVILNYKRSHSYCREGSYTAQRGEY